jgi:hypothetical protein
MSKTKSKAKVRPAAEAEKYDLAYHRKIEEEERQPAEALTRYLHERFQPRSLCDFGCSTGTYLKAWPAGLQAKRGLEGSVAAVKNAIDPSVRQWDLLLPWAPNEVDFGLCLEVLEHIPEAYARTAVRNIAGSVKDWICFSAAHPGQGGVGHINCQPQAYWLELFEDEGWVLDYPQQLNMLLTISKGPHMGWFIQNGMILRRYRRYRGEPR